MIFLRDRKIFLKRIQKTLILFFSVFIVIAFPFYVFSQGMTESAGVTSSVASGATAVGAASGGGATGNAIGSALGSAAGSIPTGLPSSGASSAGSSSSGASGGNASMTKTSKLSSERLDLALRTKIEINGKYDLYYNGDSFAKIALNLGSPSNEKLKILWWKDNALKPLDASSLEIRSSYFPRNRMVEATTIHLDLEDEEGKVYRLVMEIHSPTYTANENNNWKLKALDGSYFSVGNIYDVDPSSTALSRGNSGTNP